MQTTDGFRTTLRLLALCGWVFLALGCSGDPSSPGSPGEQPVAGNGVLATDPSDGSTGIPLAKTIRVTCEEDVLLEDTTGITLTGDSGTIPVSVAAEGNNLLIDPDPLLEQNSTYTVTISAGAVRGMNEETSFSFTTVVVNGILSTDPADGAADVPLAKTIAITCEEDVVTGDLTGVTLTADSGAVPVTVTVEGAALFIDPDSLLEQNTGYTVTVPAGAIQGVDGETEFSFITVVVNSVLSTDPADEAVDIPVTKTIAIICEEEVVPGDLTGVTLTGISGDVPVSIAAEGNRLLIDPDPLLEKNRVYTVTVPAGAIRGFDEEVSFSFTTVQIQFAELTGVVVSDVANSSIGRSDTSNNIAVSESGIVHVVWKVPNVMVNPPGAQDGVYYARSTDGGASFEPSVRVRDAQGLPTGAASYIEPEIALSGADDVLIAYPTAQGRMEVVRSTDSGASWEVPLIIGEAGTLSEQKHITADGEYVYVSSNDGDFPVPDSVDNGGNTFLRSTDTGASFQSPVTGLMGYPLHTLVVNPLNRDVYIIGTEPTGVNEPTPVYYTRSTDHGATFEPAVNSGEIITHAGYCFDRSGRIVIVGRTGTLLIGDMNTDVWTKTAAIGTSSQPLQSTMAVDGDNTIYRVGTGDDDQVHVTCSVDGGLSFVDETVDSGFYPNAASSVNMSGIAMVYSRAGVVYYAYRRP